MTIEFRDDRPPAPAADLAEAERRLAELGQRIPPSYRALLAEQDGGRPVRARFAFQQEDRDQVDSVKWFLGVAPAPDGDLVETAEALWQRVPAGVLPIAPDPVGNFVCLDGREGRDGPVLLWDHEYEGEQADDANLYEVAPDLEAFLAGLVEKPVPAAAPPQRRFRLFGRR
jgi:cell wall assembly regulator SMI1